MKDNGKKQKRSILTTVSASLIGLAILCISLLILPITNFSEGFTFGVGILLVILSAIIAVGGKKGTVRELLYSLALWR